MRQNAKIIKYSFAELENIVQNLEKKTIRTEFKDVNHRLVKK